MTGDPPDMDMKPRSHRGGGLSMRWQNPVRVVVFIGGDDLVVDGSGSRRLLQR
jgi:hypothetical protein